MLFLHAFLLASAVAGQVERTQAPHAVVSAMFEAFNRHDVQAMAMLYADDARLASSDFCAPRAGTGQVMRTYRELFAAFPGLRDDVQEMVVQGDRVAVRFVARSEAPPLDLSIVTFITVHQGRIVDDDSTFDTHGRPCSP